MISTPYIVFTKAKACDWLVTRIRKEITSKKYIRKYLLWRLISSSREENGAS